MKDNVRYRPMILKRGLTTKSGNGNAVLWTADADKYLKVLWAAQVTQEDISRIFGINSHSSALAPRINHLRLKSRFVCREEDYIQYAMREAADECPSLTPHDDMRAKLDGLYGDRLYGAA